MSASRSKFCFVDSYLPLSQKLYTVKASFFGKFDRRSVLLNDSARIVNLRDVLCMSLVPGRRMSEYINLKEDYTLRLGDTHGVPFQEPVLAAFCFDPGRRQNGIPSVLQHRHVLILNTSCTSTHMSD